MSKDWTKKELQIASAAMKAAGNIGYEEFCEEIGKSTFTAYCKDASLSQPSWNLEKGNKAGKRLIHSLYNSSLSDPLGAVASNFHGV